MRVLGVVGGRGGDGSHPCGPDLVLVHGGAGDLPDLFGADAADFFEDGLRGRAGGDEDVVGEEFEVGVGCGLGKGDE